MQGVAHDFEDVGNGGRCYDTLVSVKHGLLRPFSAKDWSLNYHKISQIRRPCMCESYEH